VTAFTCHLDPPLPIETLHSYTAQQTVVSAGRLAQSWHFSPFLPNCPAAAVRRRSVGVRILRFCNG